jgi:Xaa-Pro aminopeptidase
MSRLTRLAATLEQPLLVTNPVNIRYLADFQSSSSALLVDPSGETTLFTDFRYAESARAIEDVTFVQTRRDLFGALGERLTGQTVGFEASTVTVSTSDRLNDLGVSLVSVVGAVEALRAVKDESELAALRRAAALSDEVFAELAEEPFVGRTERELAWWIERRFRELGAEAVAFEPIVGAGATGARPHSIPGDAPIPTGTAVVVDAGCVVDGYRSDCTRTFLTGEPSDKILEWYRLCQTAQLDGLEAVKPGALASDVDAASRVVIAAAGYAEVYGHGLGHGVGIDIHEAPTLRDDSTDVLVAGNVVTIEPGLYFAGEVGFRIEDLVVVTTDGYERLTLFSKEPIVVG